MSVIVKGMEMPKNCCKCGIYCKEFYGSGESSPIFAKRLENCPLVELPEKHGRLIDADDFLYKMEQAMDGTYKKSENLYEKIMSLQIKIIISEVIKGCKAVIEVEE